MHTILEEQVEKMWEVRKANPRNYDWIVSFLRASNIAVAKAVIKEVKETLQQTSRQALDFTEDPLNLSTEALLKCTSKMIGAEKNWERTFRDKLEETLDTYFPKIKEEGEEKQANKRSPALVLFGEAVVLAKDVFQEGYKAGIRQNAIGLDQEMAEWLKGSDEASKKIIEGIRKEAVEGERKRIRDIIKKKRIGTTVFLGTQVDALVSLLSPEK